MPSKDPATFLTKEFREASQVIISKVLSYGVVTGASILKVPQILKVWRTQNADGISLTANQFELFSYVISTSWGVVQRLALSDYGENVLIFIQLVALLLLVAKIQRRTRSALLIISLQLIVFYLLSSGYISASLHESLLSTIIFFNVSSRVPQIIANYKRGSTGQLAFWTYFLAFLGGFARVVTVATNVPWNSGKGVMLTQFGVAATLNAVILLQMRYYGSQLTRRSRKVA